MQTERNIYNELKSIGLTSDQCNKVMELINSLPIHILEGINNTKVSIQNGVFIVEPADNISGVIKSVCEHDK